MVGAYETKQAFPFPTAMPEKAMGGGCMCGISPLSQTAVSKPLTENPILSPCIIKKKLYSVQIRSLSRAQEVKSKPVSNLERICTISLSS